MKSNFKIIKLTRKEKKSLLGNINSSNYINNMQTCACMCACGVCTGITNNYLISNSKRNGYLS